MKITTDTQRKHLTVFIPDTRGVTVSPFGFGNLKIGPNVYTYSRLPGDPAATALGMPKRPDWRYEDTRGTCPGATAECRAICYAARPVAEKGAVYQMWAKNSESEEVPAALPADCHLLRLHVSGDFTSPRYIRNWIDLLARNPQVTVWAYTRSWRVAELLPVLEDLRALPNVQLFASMDASTLERPPKGWRIAWIAGDARLLRVDFARYQNGHAPERVRRSILGTWSYTCPEETGHKRDCESCRYCFDGRRGDVTFLKH